MRRKAESVLVAGERKGTASVPLGDSGVLSWLTVLASALSSEPCGLLQSTSEACAGVPNSVIRIKLQVGHTGAARRSTWRVGTAALRTVV